MQRTVIICTCDICKKEIDNKEVNKIPIPVRGRNSEGYPIYKEFYKADLCEECKDKFWESSINNFADVTLSLNLPPEIEDIIIHFSREDEDNENTDIDNEEKNPDTDTSEEEEGSEENPSINDSNNEDSDTNIDNTEDVTSDENKDNDIKNIEVITEESQE